MDGTLTKEFYSPFSQILVKGEEVDGDWIIYLEASNEAPDQDGEVMEADALRKAADWFLGHGVISWDHKHKQLHEPRYIIGEPLDVQFTPEGRTLVKAKLYKENKVAQDVWANVASGARLGASVGGGILQKSGEKIQEVVWDEVAITHKPVNDETLGAVSLVPMSQFVKALGFIADAKTVANGDYVGYLSALPESSQNRYEGNVLIKALTAGSGVNPSTFSGGRTLIPESLQGNTVDLTHRKRRAKMVMRSVLKSVIEGRIKDYDDMVEHVLRYSSLSKSEKRDVVRYIAENLPSVAGKLR